MFPGVYNIYKLLFLESLTVSINVPPPGDRGKISKVAIIPNIPE
jgi:hypothetical protein